MNLLRRTFQLSVVSISISFATGAAATAPPFPIAEWSLPETNVDGIDPGIAAGTTVLGLATGNFQFYEKNGKILSKNGTPQNFDPVTFFNNAGFVWPSYATNFADPRIVWDDTHKRFWALENFGPPAEDSSNPVFWPVAISRTSDPRDGWVVTKVFGLPDNGRRGPGLPGSKTSWQTDYPQVGVSDVGLFISAASFNPKDTYEGITVVGVSAAEMLSCSAACTVPPCAPCVTNPHYFEDWTFSTDGVNANHVFPAMTHGSSTFGDAHSREYFAATHNGYLETWAIRDAFTGVETVEHNSLFLATPPSGDPDYPGLQKPDAPGTDSIELFRDTPMSLSVRSGFLYLSTSDDTSCGTFGPTQAGHLVVADLLFGSNLYLSSDSHYGCPESGETVVSQVGFVGAEVNANGNVVMFGNRFNAQNYISVRAWGLSSGTASSTSALIAAGTADYSDGGDTNQLISWSDTVGIAVDGFDDTAIWGFHMYPNGQGFNGFGEVVTKFYGSTNADLVIDGLTAYGGSPPLTFGPGAVASIYPTVRNQGDHASPAVYGTVSRCPNSGYTGCTTCATFTIPALPAGSSNTPEVNCGVGSVSGTQWLKISADTTGLVTEYSETNNSNPAWVTKTFYVTQGGIGGSTGTGGGQVVFEGEEDTSSGAGGNSGG